MISNLIVRLIGDGTSYQKMIKGAESSTNSFVSTISTAKGIIAGFAASALVAAGKSAIEAATDFRKLKKGLEAVIGDTEKAAKELEILRKLAQKPGLDLKNLIKGITQLSAAGFGLKESRNILEQYANAITIVGGTQDDLAAVVRQLTQMRAKGKLLQEDFGVIQERVPIIGRILREAFGTTSIDAIRDSGVSVEDFLDKVTEGLEGLERVDGGLSNSFNNMGNAMKDLKREAGEFLIDFLELEENIPKITEFISQMKTEFQELQKNETFIQGLIEAKNVAQGMLQIFTDIKNLIANITTNFEPISKTLKVFKTLQRTQLSGASLVTGILSGRIRNKDDANKEFMKRLIQDIQRERASKGLNPQFNVKEMVKNLKEINMNTRRSASQEQIVVKEVPLGV